MQVFRLVDPGRVDRVISFDSLPEEMLSGIKKGTANGLPSNWYQYLEIKRSDKNAMPFFVLDFRTLNRDKEKWQEIGNYVRRSTSKDFRLLDNLYDMAKPMSVDSYSSLDLEPEDVLIIPIEKIEDEDEPVAPAKAPEPVKEPIKETPPIVKEAVEIIKKRGRPKKEPVSV